MFITARESKVPSRNQVNYHMEDPVSSHTLCLNISLGVQAVGLLHLCVGFIIDFIVNLISRNFRRHKEDAVCCTVSNAPGLLGTRRSKEACSCSSQYSLHPLAPSTLGPSNWTMVQGFLISHHSPSKTPRPHQHHHLEDYLYLNWSLAITSWTILISLHCIEKYIPKFQRL